MSRVLILLFGVLLCAAVGLQLFQRSPADVGCVDVADLLPSSAGEWRKEMKPVAESVELARRVESVLRYDDVVFAELKKGAQSVSVFIAYWRPGKVSYREVAGHTPDVCWVNAGWRCVQALEDVEVGSVGGRRLMPSRTRLMRSESHSEHVWFWHVFGGQVRSYKKFGRPPWYAIITDTLKNGLEQKKEQYFVRISSGTPLDVKDGWLTPSLLELLAEEPARL